MAGRRCCQPASASKFHLAGRWGSGLEMATATDPVIDISRHRAHVRSKLEGKAVGERITFNWQAYGAGSFGRGVQDVPCVYEEQEGGSWKLISCEDPPAMF
jgi:hypothetical protein